MFGKKKIVDEPNPIVIHFKELWRDVSNAYKSIHKSMLNVITCEEVIRLYPEGVYKEEAIRRLEKAQDDFRKTIVAYDKTKDKMMQYYTVKKYDIDFNLPSWNPYSWKEGVEVVEYWYRHEKQLWIKG